MISWNPIANDLVAVQHIISVRQDDKQSTQSCQALLFALQKCRKERSSGWARCRLSDGRGVERGFGWLSPFLIKEEQGRQNLGWGSFEQILFIGQ